MPNEQISLWQTNNTASTTSAGKRNSRQITFATAEGESPNVPVGFKLLSINNNVNNNYRIGARTYASGIYEDKFTLNIDSLPHTQMYNGGAMWFKYASGDPDFQYGTVNAANTLTPTASFTKHIVFETTYATQPRVFVGLSALDISAEWNIQAYATDIDVNGFTLHIDPLGAANVYTAQVNWVAFSARRDDVTTGTISSLDANTFNGQVNIKPALSASPQLFYAISRFHSDVSQNLEIRLDVSNVSASGFNWKATATGTAKNYIVSGAYLAIAL